jgi:3-dehydroquinate dehydratase I
LRPCLEVPLHVRGIEFGSAKPLFCVPVVAERLEQLLCQAEVARAAAADLIEWRADFFNDVSVPVVLDSMRRLRLELADSPIIFTLRIKAEGGARQISQDVRKSCFLEVAASGLVDMIDVELENEIPFLGSVLDSAHDNGIHVIMSWHNFTETPPDAVLAEKIASMNRHGADVAKIAVMPRTVDDVLRLLHVTLEARRKFPRLPLCTMSMGSLGFLSRVAGFLFGSDMAFAAGQEVSAPGQIPIGEARALTEKLLHYG